MPLPGMLSIEIVAAAKSSLHAPSMAGLELERDIAKRLDPARITPLGQERQVILGSDLCIADPYRLETRVRNELEIRDISDTETLFDSLPDTFATADFQHRPDRYVACRECSLHRHAGR